MKAIFPVGLLIGICSVAFLRLNAFEPPIPLTDGSEVTISIKFGKGTNEFVTQKTNPTLVLPGCIEAQGKRFRLDFSHMPDLKEYQSEITWGDGREMRYNVTGLLRFRSGKSNDLNPADLDIIVTKMSSGPMPR